MSKLSLTEQIAARDAHIKELERRLQAEIGGNLDDLVARDNRILELEALLEERNNRLGALAAQLERALVSKATAEARVEALEDELTLAREALLNE